jgi:hypothetical protein
LLGVSDLEAHPDVQGALVVFDADVAFARAKAAFDLVEQGRSDSLSRLGVEATRELSWMDEEEAVRRIELLELLDARLEAVVERRSRFLIPLESSSISSSRPSHSSGA